MVTPKRLGNKIQPIGVADARPAHRSCRPSPEVNRAFDIAGPDVLTYREMIERFAERTGLRPRKIVTVPVLTPMLASHWVGLVTPVPTLGRSWAVCFTRWSPVRMTLAS